MTAPAKTAATIGGPAPFAPGRRLVRAYAAADRLAAWSEQARRAGRVERADALLLQAFDAYDRCEHFLGPADGAAQPQGTVKPPARA